jgi:hypothetical protein
LAAVICRGEIESGKPSLNLGLILPHSLFREKQYRYPTLLYP